MALLTVLSLALILVFYGGWNGQVAGISFIVLLASLKFLESRNLRDYFVVCVILYFLAACAFLFDSSVVSILGVFFYVVAITATLHLLSTPSASRLTPILRSSAKLLATALPLAILLFFLFPRIQGDFGFLPSRDENQDSQALADRMIAGDLALGAFNNSLAFRAEFTNSPPAPHERYWRVKVLTSEQNFQWELAPDKIWLQDGQALTGQGALLAEGAFNYTIIHQETTDRYLPYLDYLRGFSIGVLLENTVVKVREARGGAFSYSGSADRTQNFSAPVKSENKPFLQTVSQPSARMREQLAVWRTQATSDNELALRVLQHFRDHPFSYTLLPPILDEEQPLEDFFFNTQSGYCEHYASTFATIMRWLNVPARVVVGYQGGELNPTGSFIEVRYSDAHAWTELWLDGQWRRYDPTAAISPDRIEFGMQAMLEMWDGYRFSDQIRGRALANYLNPQGFSAAYRFVRQSWSNISYQWNKWVVNYDVEAQRQLLDALGLAGFKTLTTLVVLLIVGIGSLTLLQLLPAWLTRQSPPPEQLLLQQLLKKIRRAGIDYAPQMTMRDIARAIQQVDPEQTQRVNEIVRTYEALRYAKTTAAQRTLRIGQLKELISKLKLARPARLPYLRSLYGGHASKT